MGVARATAAPHPRGSGGRFTPIGKMKKGGSAAALLVYFYRKDAKGGAAHSVRDRLTALLTKRMRLKRDRRFGGCTSKNYTFHAF